jgi:hypothetical protein
LEGTLAGSAYLATDGRTIIAVSHITTSISFTERSSDFVGVEDVTTTALGADCRRITSQAISN